MSYSWGMNVGFGWNSWYENNGLEQLVWQQLAGITGMEMAGDTECQNNSNYPITQEEVLRTPTQ
jgi:hypothetical protein